MEKGYVRDILAVSGHGQLNSIPTLGCGFASQGFRVLLGRRYGLGGFGSTYRLVRFISMLNHRMVASTLLARLLCLGTLSYGSTEAWIRASAGFVCLRWVVDMDVEASAAHIG